MIDIVTIIALFLGPLVAVWIARGMDDRRAKYERRMRVFRALMSTRSNTLSPDHVSALNLVEIEFHGNSEVVDKWKAYFNDLAEYPRLENEKVLEGLSDAEIARRQGNYDKRVRESRSRLLTKLLYEMAQVLGYEKIKVLEILEGSYFPQGWGRIEAQQELIRQYAIDLYFGKNGIARACPLRRTTNQRRTKKNHLKRIFPFMTSIVCYSLLRIRR